MMGLILGILSSRKQILKGTSAPESINAKNYAERGRAIKKCIIYISQEHLPALGIVKQATADSVNDP